MLKGLEKYRLGNSLTGSILKGEVPDEIFPAVKGGGLLPSGISGRIAFGELCSEAQVLADRVRDATRREGERILELKGQIGNCHLSGRVPGIFGDTLVRFRFAAIKGVDRLKIWLELLVLQALLGASAPARSLLVGTDESWECEGHADPERVLRELLEVYALGLTRPLAFFPETSLDYFRRLQQQPANPEKALEGARKSWESSDHRRGESEDPYYALGFPDEDPLSEGIFRPLLKKSTGPWWLKGGKGKACVYPRTCQNHCKGLT